MKPRDARVAALYVSITTLTILYVARYDIYRAAA
jgi:hypothetical protein